jgi:hypothetical protein
VQRHALLLLLHKKWLEGPMALGEGKVGLKGTKKTKQDNIGQDNTREDWVKTAKDKRKHHKTREVKTRQDQTRQLKIIQDHSRALGFVQKQDTAARAHISRQHNTTSLVLSCLTLS